MRLAWMEGLDDAEKQQQIEQAFQNVAATRDGALVFAAIFESLFFFWRTDTAEQQALNNFAKELLGCFGEDTRYRVMDAIIGGQRSVSKQG